MIRAGLILIALGAAYLGWIQYGSVMQPKEVGRYEIWLGEYWEWNGEEKVDFPLGVKWGFYPPTANAAAIECAEESYEQLVAFLRGGPQHLAKLVENGAARRFALWTNDYSNAAAGRKERPASVWHWSPSTPHDYSDGFWKWEATLTSQGDCQIPTVEEALTSIAQVKNAGPFSH